MKKQTKHTADIVDFEAVRARENVEQRQENVKVFDLGCGRHQAIVYAEPVHYRDSKDDQWKAIDNTLELVDAKLNNRGSRTHVELAAKTDADA